MLKKESWPKYLSRYTQIPTLLYMLGNKKLFLSDPSNWSDKTDAAFLKKYAGNENIRALCLFENNERNHYWELYAKHGCMIEFNTEALLGKIPDNSNFIFGKVQHILQNDFDLKKHQKKLPFIKQHRYKDEKEYRLIWKGDEETKAFVPIDLKSITKIIISGDIDNSIAVYLKTVIRKIAGKDLSNTKINSSQLYDNNIWRKKIGRQ